MPVKEKKPERPGLLRRGVAVLNQPSFVALWYRLGAIADTQFLKDEAYASLDSGPA